MAGLLISATVTCVFTIVGVVLGGVTGGLIGLVTECGVFRGRGVGAISGALFSIDVVESTLSLWRSRDSKVWSILYVIDILSSLLSGRLIREKVDPVVQSAVQSQMNDRNTRFEEVTDIFETGGNEEGMTRDSVEKLPWITINKDDEKVNEFGERISCAVCLQDFQTGEAARNLPNCQHIFHLSCIDNWLIRHGSCPLCRRSLYELRVEGKQTSVSSSQAALVVN